MIAETTFGLRNIPWFDYDPEAVRIFKGIIRNIFQIKYFLQFLLSNKYFEYAKDRWRNYIKPGFNINVGNILTNYDIAMNYDDKIALDTPVIGKYPHTQVSCMPAEFDLQWYNQSDVEHPDLTSQIKEAFKAGFYFVAKITLQYRYF